MTGPTTDAARSQSSLAPTAAPVQYVGTIVGESTTREFRLAVAHETIREQDIVAVDAQLRLPGGDGASEEIRVWAKVQRIERLNPLFPSESAHELAATRTDPFDTVLSLSREMVTAVCQVLGVEPLAGSAGAKLRHLRYPPRPASSTYRPSGGDLDRVLLGDLQSKAHRALDIATLSNRDDVAVRVDGQQVVTRHLAILAMTGAGKSWAARRVIEQIARKDYPIVIFDPHGDYAGLADVPDLAGRVTRYYASFPVFEEDSDTVAGIVSALGYALTDTMQTRFGDVFKAAQKLPVDDAVEAADRAGKLATMTGSDSRARFGLTTDLFLLADIAQAASLALARDDAAARQQLVDWGWPELQTYSKTDVKTLEGIMKRSRKAAAVLRRMEKTNRKVAGQAAPMPKDRTSLVRPGQVSLVSLAGYTGEFQATIYSVIAEEIFEARVNGELNSPVLLVLEEAHNFVPAKANTAAEQRSIAATKQIAQEGRKFGVGLVLISQRPSRLDETTLSQCNSYIILRMVNPADQNFVRRVVESLTEDEARLLPGLDNGEALLSGQFVNFPVLARITPPDSQGEHEEEDVFLALANSRAAARAAGR